MISNIKKNWKVWDINIIKYISYNFSNKINLNTIFIFDV